MPLFDFSVEFCFVVVDFFVVVTFLVVVHFVVVTFLVVVTFSDVCLASVTSAVVFVSFPLEMQLPMRKY